MASYLRQLARRAHGNLPLLKPPRSFARREGPLSGAQRLLTNRQSTVPFSQASARLAQERSTVFSKEAEPATPVREQSAEEAVPEVTQLSPDSLFKGHTSDVPATRIVFSPGKAPGAHLSADVVPQPRMEVQITPEQPISLPAAQVETAPDAPRSASSPDTVRTQKATSQQGNEDGMQKGDTGKQSPTQIMLASLPRPTPVRPARESARLQGTAIHIGTIEVQILPPPIRPSPAPSVPSAARPQPASLLSRELTSSFGLRQG